MTDIFTGAESPRQLLYEGKVVGEITVFNPDGSYSIKSASDLGIRCPVCESLYYDEEVVMAGRAAYKKPYYSGTKKHNGKTIKYVGYFDWKKVKGWLP